MSLGNLFFFINTSILIILKIIADVIVNKLVVFSESNLKMLFVINDVEESYECRSYKKINCS